MREPKVKQVPSHRCEGCELVTLKPMPHFEPDYVEARCPFRPEAIDGRVLAVRKPNALCRKIYNNEVGYVPNKEGTRLRGGK